MLFWLMHAHVGKRAAHAWAPCVCMFTHTSVPCMHLAHDATRLFCQTRTAWKVCFEPVVLFFPPLLAVHVTCGFGSGCVGPNARIGHPLSLAASRDACASMRTGPSATLWLYMVHPWA